MLNMTFLNKKSIIKIIGNITDHLGILVKIHLRHQLTSKFLCLFFMLGVTSAGNLCSTCWWHMKAYKGCNSPIKLKFYDIIPPVNGYKCLHRSFTQHYVRGLLSFADTKNFHRIETDCKYPVVSKNQNVNCFHALVLQASNRWERNSWQKLNGSSSTQKLLFSYCFIAYVLHKC